MTVRDASPRAPRITAQRMLQAGLMTAALAGPWLAPVRALVRFNDGKDQVFLVLKGGVISDSNIFASAQGERDIVLFADATAEYERKAGLISVDASLGAEAGFFQEFSEEDYLNPKASLQFTKNGGRTTGSLALSAQRESRADVAVNVRTKSWDYHSTLKVRYPVIEKYSIAGELSYDQRDFLDNPQLIDLDTYTASADVFYAYSSQRDLFAGYRLRVSESAADRRYADHALTTGISGKITPRLNGTFRIGYQVRDESGPRSPENHDGLTTALAATWSIGSRATLTGQLSKDFATTATDVSNDTSAATLDFKFSVTARLNTFAGVGAGRTQFLGQAGARREDTYATANLGATYAFNKKFTGSLAYTYFNNWSTLALADYDRHTLTASLSARY